MPRELKFESVVIDDDSDCFVIASIDLHHARHPDALGDAFNSVKDAGARAINLIFPDSHRLAGGDLDLVNRAKALGLAVFSPARDFEWTDLLGKLAVSGFYIEFGDLQNRPLLKHVASFRLPMLLNTGGADLDDVRRAHSEIIRINPKLAILQSTAAFRSKDELLNLRVISTFREEFPDCVIGFSDRDNSTASPVGAYVLGARIIERPFALDPSLDEPYALNPLGLNEMIRDLSHTRLALGLGRSPKAPAEVGASAFPVKRIIASGPLKAGQRLKRDDFAFKPGDQGFASNDVDSILGRELAKDIAEESPILEEDLQ